jgi:quercetin 2,3-dioxygenase
MPMSPRPAKTLEAVTPPPAMHWVGNGFPVRTMLSYAHDAELWSPFVLLDYAAPRAFSATSGVRGVGEHPHRGFETVTVAYQGEIEHRDSAGHAGRIGPGDVQWMTAGSGVVHEELHGKEFSRAGGVMEMAQIWVNLPARSKRTAPRYQDLRAARIPAVELPGGAGRLRVIAGAHGDARGPAHTFTPVAIWDLHLEPGAHADLDLPEGHTALLLARGGEARVNDAELPAHHLARLSRTGGSVRVAAAPDAPADLLFLGGEPLGEPVAGYGPFVMNTRDEIRQAVEDYEAGRMGHLR